MNRYAALFLAALGFLAPGLSLADMPSSIRTKSERVFEFGDVIVKQSFNSMKDPMDPEFKLMVYDKSRLLLQLNDVAFDSFYASPDKRLFVGLSNSGWPGSAVIIFNERGRILLLAEHGLGKFDYCAETSTMLKEWYSPKNVQIRFPVWDPKKVTTNEKELPGIMINDCHGNPVDLLDLLSAVNRNAYAKIRFEIYFDHATR